MHRPRRPHRLPDAGSCRRLARVAIRPLAALCLWLLAAGPAAGQTPHNVLILTSEATELPGLGLVVDQTVSTVRATSGPVNVYVESFERSSLPADREFVVALYKQRYAGRRLDLVVTVCEPALNFALRHRDEIFPGVPILFSFVDPGMVPPRRQGDNVSGVFLAPDWVPLIKQALDLHRGVRRLIVVAGASPFDQGWLTSLRQVIATFDSRLTTRYLIGLPLRDLLGELALAPDDALVLYLTVSRDSHGTSVIPRDVLGMIRRVSPVPLYGPSSTYLGHGVVGGPLMDIPAHGADVGRMAARVLAGERADRIGPVTTSTTLAFDWRELQRFGIAESALPGGAAVFHRAPGFWTFHPGWIIAAVLLLGGQTTLIVTMLAQRGKRAALERSLTARLRFETVLSDVSAALGGVSIQRMDMAVHAAVEAIRGYLGVDRVSVFELTADGRAVCTVDECRPGSPAVPAGYQLARMPSIALALTSLQPFVVERRQDLPADASPEREMMREVGIRSLAIVPLEVGGQALGALSCVSHTSERSWPADLVQQVRTLGQALANVVQRRQTDTAVAESDRLRGDILSSMPAQIAVLDRDGVIIGVNDAWTAYGRARGVRGEASISSGASYVGVCDRAASDGVPGAADAAAGVRAVCEGRLLAFDCDYVLDCGDGEQWFAMKVVPLRRADGGAVVTHRDITEQKRQETALRESERRFRLLADALPIGVWMSGLDRGRTYFNREWLRVAGRPVELELGDGWLERVHPDDLQAVNRTYSTAFEAREPYETEYRLRRHDGGYRWMLSQGTPRYDAAGEFHGFVGGCVDITERIVAEKRQRELSGRLISSQEDERRRIARELHDDLQQRLALLAIELDGMALGRPPLAGAEVAARARDLWRQTIEIATEVHNLSYRLHPSKLEALGLLSTVQGYCRDLSKHGLQVAFAHDGMPASVGADTALCVFRLVQESLQNVLKHSGVREARVSMTGGAGTLRVVVADAGRGFDADTAGKRGGLGLVSMRERLHLVGGSMTVRSSVGGGTTIEFQVPVRDDETAPPDGAAALEART